MTKAQDRTLAIVLGGVLALVFTLWAAISLAGGSVGRVHRDEHHVLRGPVRELRIDGSSGDITLLPTAGRDVVVDSRAEGSLSLPKVHTQIDGGLVSLGGSCKWVVFGSCGVSFVVHVPHGTAVTVDTSSGDVQASGLTGPVNISVSSGDVSAEDLPGGATLDVQSGDVDLQRIGGRLKVSTSSGDVNATELTARDVSVQATSGDVGVDLAAVPRSVDAAGSSGDITIVVPRALGGPYRAQAETTAGDRLIAVRTDPASPRSLRAVTTSGDVRIVYGER